MTDFINYSAKKKPKKIIMCETTKTIVEDVVDNLEDLTEEETVMKINESKKAVAKKTKKGIRVKQSLNG